MLSTEASSPAWDENLLRDPHAVADKQTRVRRMFAAIAPSYDLNNRLHSLWMDQSWRRKAVKVATLRPLEKVVDVACGTGDLTVKFAEEVVRLARARNAHVDPFREQRIPSTVLGLDFTFEMLPIARDKTPGRRWSFLDPAPRGGISCTARIPYAQYLNADAQALPLPDTSADVVSIAFGIRNVADPFAAVKEFHRVLRPGGRLIILEFSLPTNPLLRGLYNFYFRKVLPRTATLISGDKTGAYKYLPESVNTFIGRAEMMGMMAEAGFSHVEQFPMTFGVCVCYRGVKA